MTYFVKTTISILVMLLAIEAFLTIGNNALEAFITAYYYFNSVGITFNTLSNSVLGTIYGLTAILVTVCLGWLAIGIYTMEFKPDEDDR